MSNPGPAITTGTPSQNLSTQQAVRLLCSAKNINVNATGDQAAMPILDSSSYAVKFVVVTGSISMTTAAAGLFPAPAAGGTATVSNGALSGIDSATEVIELTVNNTDIQTSQTQYLNVGTAQGAAATLNIWVYGYDLS